MLTMSSGLSMERMMVIRLRGTPLSWARWYTSSHCCHLLFSLKHIPCKYVNFNIFICSHFNTSSWSSVSVLVFSTFWASDSTHEPSPTTISVARQLRNMAALGNKDIKMEHFFMIDIGLTENRKICKPYHCGSSLSKEASSY